MIKVINGNSIEELKKFPDNYFGSVVTDPPYGLSFMGKKWDYDVPNVELWKEVFRVLKEGGHLLAFAGTRTQHRMAVNIEEAGFEIRDMIAWVYGSGFPKSHNIGKAVDKYKRRDYVEAAIHLGVTPKSSASWRDWTIGEHAPSDRYWEDFKNAIPEEQWKHVEREVIGKRKSNAINQHKWLGEKYNKHESNIIDITAPATQEAKQWEGWGTALKPALEPITMARKPFKSSVAENVLKNGVGGINIDGCRVKLSKGENTKRKVGGHKTSYIGGKMKKNFDIENQANRDLGRFPANFIHDGSDEVKDLLEESSRFFYCAKASKQDREENNNHPTVKPTDLMRYLVRLVTPKNETVLDCFMGSGSTGKACALEGLSFVGIDLDKDYCKIAKARIDKALEDKRIMDSQTKLF